MNIPASGKQGTRSGQGEKRPYLVPDASVYLQPVFTWYLGNLKELSLFFLLIIKNYFGEEKWMKG